MMSVWSALEGLLLFPVAKDSWCPLHRDTIRVVASLNQSAGMETAVVVQAWWQKWQDPATSGPGEAGGPQVPPPHIGQPNG